MQAMILAAGLGTRLQPLTNDRPKAMVEVAGRPLLEHIILKMKRQGFNRLVVNIHHFGQMIVDFLKANDNFGMDIRLSDERGLLLNIGGGVKKALELFDPNEPILIHNVDIASDADLAALYREAQREVGQGSQPCGALLATNSRATNRFLLFTHEGFLRGWLNEYSEGDKGKAMGNEPISELERWPFTGIHVLTPALFEALRDYPQEMFSIIDFYLSVCIEHPIKRTSLPADCRWVDCGRVEALDEAGEILG